MEVAWLRDLRYRYRQAHKVRVTPTTVELDVATQSSEDGYYITGLIVATSSVKDGYREVAGGGDGA
jgi:hypothetical protein